MEEQIKKDEKDEISGQIDSYYDSWFEINNTYHIWANKRGMHETTLFILYVISSAVPYCTQREICQKLFLPKQTVSQIILGLEKVGYVVKEINENDRRNKIIRFTEAGENYAKPILEELKSAEMDAFKQLSEEQRRTIVESFTLLSNSLIKTFTIGN